MSRCESRKGKRSKDRAHPMRKNSLRMSRSQGRHSASPPSTRTAKSSGSRVLGANHSTCVARLARSLTDLLVQRSWRCICNRLATWKLTASSGPQVSPATKWWPLCSTVRWNVPWSSVCPNCCADRSPDCMTQINLGCGAARGRSCKSRQHIGLCDEAKAESRDVRALEPLQLVVHLAVCQPRRALLQGQRT